MIALLHRPRTGSRAPCRVARSRRPGSIAPRPPSGADARTLDPCPLDCRFPPRSAALAYLEQTVMDDTGRLMSDRWQRLGFTALGSGWVLIALVVARLPTPDAAAVLLLLSYICLGAGVVSMWIARSHASQQRRTRMTRAVLLLTLGIGVSITGHIVGLRRIGPDIGLGLIIFGGHLVMVIGSLTVTSPSRRQAGR